MLRFSPRFCSTLPKATDLGLQRDGCVSPLCPNPCVFSLFRDNLFFQVSNKGLTPSARAGVAVGAAQGTLPAAAEDFCRCGKRIDISFLKTGIAKHRMVLLEPERNCPGAAFWWKRPVTGLNLQ